LEIIDSIGFKEPARHIIEYRLLTTWDVGLPVIHSVGGLLGICSHLKVYYPARNATIDSLKKPRSSSISPSDCHGGPV